MFQSGFQVDNIKRESSALVQSLADLPSMSFPIWFQDWAFKLADVVKVKSISSTCFIIFLMFANGLCMKRSV